MSYDLTQLCQNENNFPWHNGQAYAEFVGYNEVKHKLEKEVASCIDDLHDVMENLREEKLYEHADRLRFILGKLARSRDCLLITKGDPALISEIAKGYR